MSDTLVRFLAPFVWKGEMPRLEEPVWVPLGKGKGETHDRFKKTLRFFLDAARPIFDPDKQRLLLVRNEGPDDDDLNAMEFLLHTGTDERLGVLVLEVNWTGDLLRDLAKTEKRLRDRATAILNGTVGKDWSFFLYGRRLLTWVRERRTRGPSRERLFDLCENEAPPNRFTTEALEALVKHSGLELWEGWSALIHRDNFAATIDPDVAPESVTMMVDGDLFRLYQLALFLKLRTVQLMTQASKLDDNDRHGRAPLLEAILAFRKRFWFREVTRNTTGRAMYEVLLRAMAAEDLLKVVNDEVDALETHLERGTQSRLAKATFALFPAVLLTGILGMNVGFETFNFLGGHPFLRGTSLILLAAVIAGPLTWAVYKKWVK